MKELYKKLVTLSVIFSLLLSVTDIMAIASDFDDNTTVETSGTVSVGSV